jgi:hypothetical protein
MNTWEPIITQGLALVVKIDTTCFRSNQYAYYFYRFLPPAGRGSSLLFPAATLVESTALEATYANVSLQLCFCIVSENLMYLPMYTQNITIPSHRSAPLSSV